MMDLNHFGLIAPYYERLFPLRKPERLIEVSRLPAAGPLLDAGGGTGRVAQALHGYASQIVVADLSIEMLRQASRKEGIQAVCSHTESLPFPDDYFERILMIDALHHVYSHVKTAAELWRVLKPGGRLVIQEPDFRSMIVKLVAVFEKAVLMRSHFLAPANIAALFSFPGAEKEIERDRFNAWVIVEKAGQLL
jgi:demethylmenaquinone methyltransferase/2-methoxy-6-polyprenyl-1,4-benzoquinol methylase